MTLPGSSDSLPGRFLREEEFPGVGDVFCWKCDEDIDLYYLVLKVRFESANRDRVACWMTVWDLRNNRRHIFSPFLEWTKQNYILVAEAGNGASSAL